MNFLNSDFFSFIKSRFGSSTSVPRCENIKRAIASSKFCSILFKLHDLVPMVNCHHQVHEQLDWMKSGQLLHPSIHGPQYVLAWPPLKISLKEAMVLVYCTVYSIYYIIVYYRYSWVYLYLYNVYFQSVYLYNIY